MKIKNIDDRHDYLSVDGTRVLSCHGEFFHVGQEVKHEGADENEIGIIERFELDVEDNSILAYTTKGHGHIEFLYTDKPKLKKNDV